jgi:hypothetical protein
MTAKWQWQDLRDIELVELVEMVRADYERTGELPRKQWDHNHPEYRDGWSNKRVMIAASILLGRPERRVTANEAWALMYRLAGIPYTAEVRVTEVRISGAFRLVRS